MKRFAILLLLSALLQAGTRSGPHLQPRRQKAPDVIWTDGVMQLSKSQLSHQPKLGYAVLKARPSKALTDLLPEGSMLAPLPQTWDLNYYLVPIDRISTLQRLANWAHASTGMCGSIEFIKNSSTVADATTIYPPIYSGRVVFDEARTLIDQVSLDTMDQTIDTLAALPSRYFRHATGENAHTTVRQIWEAIMISGRWTITEVSQSLSNQKTVIARLEGTSKPDETLIIGAHLDSIVSRSGNSTIDNAPGADDDASGIAALTEILRLIENNQLKFDRSIELHAYAAEEVGLVGSKEVATQYAAAGKKIVGMYQIDMAYYSQLDGSGIIHLLEDYTSRDLRRQTIDWIRSYMGQVYKLGVLPRGSASDHKSFYDAGYPTVFPFEDPSHYNPYIHTGDDVRAHFDDGLLLKRITQLALLFTVYQGGWQGAAASYEKLKAGLSTIDAAADLYVAIQNATDGYYLAISAPLETTTLEYCLIENGADLYCNKERERLDKEASGSLRKFFFTTNVLSLSAGQKWRVQAYNATDQLIAFRQFTLSAP